MFNEAKFQEILFPSSNRRWEKNISKRTLIKYLQIFYFLYHYGNRFESPKGNIKSSVTLSIL